MVLKLQLNGNVLNNNDKLHLSILNCVLVLITILFAQK